MSFISSPGTGSNKSPGVPLSGVTVNSNLKELNSAFANQLPAAEAMEFSAALGAMARAHGVMGNLVGLDPLPVERASGRRLETIGQGDAGYFHAYLKAAADGKAWSVRRGIYTSPNLRISRARYAFVHEIGHYLDHWAIGEEGRFSSEDPNSPLAEVMMAIRKSDAYRELLEMKESGFRPVFDGSIKYHREMDGDEVRELDWSLKEGEMFARAYAQWVALQSGDARMKKSIDEMKLGEYAHWMPLHWEDQNFQPIASVLEKTFTDSSGLVRSSNMISENLMKLSSRPRERDLTPAEMARLLELIGDRRELKATLDFLSEEEAVEVTAILLRVDQAAARSKLMRARNGIRKPYVPEERPSYVDEDGWTVVAEI